jgi:hypothetical protein
MRAIELKPLELILLGVVLYVMPDLISLELKDGNAPTLEELLAQPLIGDTAGTKPFA